MPNDEDLLHYGVKGMRWGHRKKYEPTDRDRGNPGPVIAEHNASTKEYMALSKKLRNEGKPKNQKEAAKNLAENQEKFLAKFEPDDADPKKGLSPEQKAALKKAAVGIAVVGGIAALAYYGNKRGAFDNLPGLGGKKIFGPTTDPSKMINMAGKPLSADQYSANVQHSMREVWSSRQGSGFIRDSSYLRPETTFPAGHKFHRISTQLEDTFGHATYSTPSLACFNRYNVSFIGGVKDYKENLHHVTWATTKDFKVPNLRTVLDTVHEVMQAEGDLPASMATKEYATSWYAANAGGRWNNPRAEAVFSALKQKGYSAIVDEMDAGVQGDMPLVIFDHDGLTSKVANLITRDDLRNAHNSVTELANRKF